MLEENKSNENELQRLGNETQKSQETNQIQQIPVVGDGESSGELVVGINADIANKQMLRVTTEGFVGKASDYLEVINVIKNLDTDRVRVTLRHLSNYCDREVTIDMAGLKRTVIFNTFTSKGIVVFEWCAGALSQYLIEEIDDFIKQGKMVYQHEYLGWNNVLDKAKGFFASNSINAPYPSIMRGNDDCILGPNGDKESYITMIQKEVIPNKSLHLPFVLAFTSPIVPLMYDKSACPVLMTNFSGKSSQGKTTSLALMASVWGRGIVANDRLSTIKTFASTQNGFQASVNRNNGVLVCFDDYEAASTGLNFGSLIYDLAQGESKIRCDKYGQPKDTYQWRTTIALTGESSIFDRAGHNLGLRPRIVEFKNKSWTVSKANSIAITSIISSNYGFYGEEFVKGLMTITDEELDQYYDSSNAIIESLLPSHDNISDRIQTRLVLIRMTAELVRKLLDLDIDVDYITKFMVDNELNRQASLDIFEEAKEKITTYITSNLPRFVRTDKEYQETSLPSSTIVGRIYNGQKGYMVAMLPDAFKSIISEFNDKDAILEHWRDEGFLVVDSDKKRFTKKVKVTSHTMPSRCYVFLFEDTGTLKQYLTESETIVPQDLVDDDREKRLNGLVNEPPKHTYYKGHKYKLVVEKSEPSEHLVHPVHDNSNVAHSSLNEVPPKAIPEIGNVEYDGTEEINEIYEEGEDD